MESINNRQGKIFFYFLQSHGYAFHTPDQPTRISSRGFSSTLDICLSKGLQTIIAETVSALSSDRNPVIFIAQLQDFNLPPYNIIKLTNW
ncbi:hypothetical protein NPIL_120111 [Nephila pilipes]|uniref:Uncharacterized protein n=1 Tax=Nephila pilipes TaxID=299642 RepID=A0A8X6T8A8_NEPPI|nr:hypothetical protein NPIL_120111 [Nephila pilipes]